MKRFSTILLICLLAGVVGCSPMINVSQSYDNAFDFSEVKTWAWVPHDAPEAFDEADSLATARNEALNNAVQAAIEKEMEKKGISKTAGDADISVAYSFGQRMEVFVDNWTAPYYMQVGWSQQSSVQDASLMIDFVDEKGKELIWRGTAVVAPNVDPSPDIIERNVNKAVSKIFTQYPPGSGS